MLNTQFSFFEGVKEEVFEEQNRIEASLNLSDSYMDKILSVSGDATGGFCDITAGELRYGGRITFNAVYMGEEMERVEAGAEFSFKKLGTFDEGNAFVKYTIGSINIKKSGGVLYAEAVVNALITYERRQSVNYLADVDALKKENELSYSRTITCSQAFELDDEFECVKLKKVLCSMAHANIIHAQTAQGAVVCDGEVVLSCVLLPFAQNNDIVKERRVIPFRLEMEMDEAVPDMPIAVCAEVAGLSLKVYVDEESDKSTVATEFNLKLSAFAEVRESITAVCDAYSCSSEIKIKAEKAECDCISGMLVRTEKASGRFTCDIPENSRFINVIGEGAEIAGVYEDGDELHIDALVYGDAIFVDGDGCTVSRRVEMPISLQTEKDFIGYSNVELNIYNLTAKLRSGQIEAEITLKLSLFKLAKTSFDVIAEIEEGAEKCPNSSAISIYIAKKGDTEWEVMKQLGVAIDKIYELNSTLEFPLCGNEKIILYRQKC